MNLKPLLIILAVVVTVESTALALPYLSHVNVLPVSYQKAFPQSASYPFMIFNQPITNDTEHEFDPFYGGSWQADITSSLSVSSHLTNTMAEIAFAPGAPSESHAIPAIIVQERSDGLLRVEYFAQNWANTYGLLLYNSTSPGWTRGENVTLIFQSTGPPSAVDPQLAPRPNGMLEIRIGGAVVVPEYPIAWANLSELYLYGYPTHATSPFTGGTIRVSLYQI